MRSKHRLPKNTAWSRIGIAASHLPEGTISDMISRHPRQQLTWLGLLAAPLLLPVAIPGVATTVGAFCLVVALSTLVARPIPLPKWLGQRRLPTSFGKFLQKIIQRLSAVLARRSKPRLLRLSSSHYRFINGTMLALAGTSMMIPVPIISFDNVVPAAAVVLLALGLRVRDGAMLIAGYITTAFAWIYVALLWWVGVELLTWIYRFFVEILS